MTSLFPAPVPTELHGLPAGVLLLADRRTRGAAIGEHQGLQLQHLPAADPCQAGLGLLHEPGLAAATACTPGNETQSWLGLEFAVHLADYRRAHAIPPLPCLIAPVRPDPVPDEAVRIPHLAEVAYSPGQITDLVIWELMPGRDAAAWLGQPLPGQAWFKDRLPALLSLRRQLRDGTLPSAPWYSRLSTALAGRYLSIRFAYQNPALIAEAVASACTSEHGTTPARCPDDQS